MKKNTLFYIIGAAVIVIAVVALAIFLIATRGLGTTESFSLEGTWKVYARYKNVVDEEYMVFTEDTVTDYRNGSEAFTGSYEWIDNDTSIKIPSLNKEFYIHKKTENAIVLVEPGDTEQSYLRWELVRVDNYPVTFNQADIKGDWTVVIHSDGVAEGEMLRFADNTMEFYREGALAKSSTYVWRDENTVYIEGLDMLCKVYKVDSDTVVLVQYVQKDNYTDYSIWEIKVQK